MSNVLVTMSVSSDNNGLCPSWHESRHVFADDGFSEDGTIQDVSNGSVGGSPHFLELELLNSIFVGGNSCAFDADFVFFDCHSSVYCHLIVGLVSVFHAEIEVLNIEVKIRCDVL